MLGTWQGSIKGSPAKGQKLARLQVLRLCVSGHECCHCRPRAVGVRFEAPGVLGNKPLEQKRPSQADGERRHGGASSVAHPGVSLAAAQGGHAGGFCCGMHEVRLAACRSGRGGKPRPGCLVRCPAAVARQVLLAHATSSSSDRPPRLGSPGAERLREGRAWLPVPALKCHSTAIPACRAHAQQMSTRRRGCCALPCEASHACSTRQPAAAAAWPVRLKPPQPAASPDAHILKRAFWSVVPSYDSRHVVAGTICGHALGITLTTSHPALPRDAGHQVQVSPGGGGVGGGVGARGTVDSWAGACAANGQPLRLARALVHHKGQGVSHSMRRRCRRQHTPLPCWH